MDGKVYIINHQIGWIGILTENNSFSISEVLEMTLPSIGDIVSGDLESLGGEMLFNHSSHEGWRIYSGYLCKSKRSYETT